MSVFIECKKLSVDYGNHKVLSDVNLNLARPSVMWIFGKNGSGKSTLLKVLAGLNESFSGIVNKSPCVFLGHKLACRESFTVSQNLSMWLSWYRVSNALKIKSIDRFGLGSILSIYYSELSAGWKKRVALSRLVISNRLLWLLDEPFTNLDSEGRNLLINAIVDNYDRGGISIITTHESIEIPIYCEILKL